jgi:hypothetical protein
MVAMNGLKKFSLNQKDTDHQCVTKFAVHLTNNRNAIPHEIRTQYNNDATYRNSKCVELLIRFQFVHIQRFSQFQVAWKLQ